MLEVSQHAQILKLFGVCHRCQNDLLFGGVQNLFDKIYDEIQNAGVVSWSQGYEIDQSEDIVKNDKAIVTALCILENSDNFIHDLPLIKPQKSVTVDNLGKGAFVKNRTFSCKKGLSCSCIAPNQKGVFSVF